MPDKTARLAGLLPEVYAARFADGLLYRLLDAVGRQLADTDAGVKRLLSSHWVEHAAGEGLDALAATFGQRRRHVDGGPESDEALRARLRTLVARFTGGGTVASVTGAVRSALGLPFDAADLPLPAGSPLAEAIVDLVRLSEFSPQRAVVAQTASAITVDANRSRLDLLVDLPSVQPDRPVIELTVTSGLARNISVSVRLGGTDHGLAAQPQLALSPGETLVLETVLGSFAARVVGPAGQRSVGYLFRSLDGGPPEIPLVPVGASTWVFRAGSGFADPPVRPIVPPFPPFPPLPPFPPVRPFPFDPLDPLPARRRPSSSFDEDTFDLPAFGVSLSWTVYTPLTFEVSVPYFLTDEVQRLCRQFGYTGRVFTHEGLPRDQIQDIVDTTRAAGVRGRVSFTVALPLDGADRHDAVERLTTLARLRTTEQADARESLAVGSISTLAQVHDQDETVWLGGVFDVSTFDGGGWAFGG